MRGDRTIHRHKKCHTQRKRGGQRMRYYRRSKTRLQCQKQGKQQTVEAPSPGSRRPLILDRIVLICLRRRLLSGLRLARLRRHLVIHLHLRVLCPVLLLRACRSILLGWSVRLRRAGLSLGFLRRLFRTRFRGGVRQLDILLRLARPLRPRLLFGDTLSETRDLCDACTAFSYKRIPLCLRRRLDLDPASVSPAKLTD